MLLGILSIILTFDLAFAGQKGAFTVGFRTRFKNVPLHKMIAEREVLTSGKECGGDDLPHEVDSWGCDKDGLGILCKKSYKCLSGRGEERGAHIKHVESMIAEKVKQSDGKCKKLRFVRFESKKRKRIYLHKTDHKFFANNCLASSDSSASRKIASVDDSSREEIPIDELPVGGSSVESEKITPRKWDGSEQFNFSVNTLKDQTHWCIRTGHIAWTPRYRILGPLMFGIDLGMQILDNPESGRNYFVAMDGMLAGYVYIASRTYVKVVRGIQRWYDETGESHYLVGAGLGFELSGVINRFFIQYIRVDNEAQNREYRVGFGFSF